MNFEPQKFFIGLIDFFSILLPGALLTYLLKDDAGPLFLGDAYHQMADIEGWAIFLFSSYLLGHFIFPIGSWVDGLDKTLRKATYPEQLKALADGKEVPSRLARCWLGSSSRGMRARRSVTQRRS